VVVAGPGAEIVEATAGRVVVDLLINSGDLLTEFGAGAKVYLERDTSSAFAAPTALSSTAITSGTEQIAFSDTSGTSASWYRVRVGDAAGALFTAYSAGVQASEMLTYAPLEALLDTMSVANADTKSKRALADALVDASAAITIMCGRDFYRHPQISGTETRLYNVRFRNASRLSTALGFGVDIISIDTLELAYVTNGTFTTIAQDGTGFALETFDPGAIALGWPYEDIILSPIGSNFRAFSYGDGVVRPTGVFGWPSVPRMVRRATLDLAREMHRQGPGGGGPIGISQLGAPVFSSGTPPSVWQLYKSDYRRRDFASI
jgi:hypothetical protein